MLGCGLHGERGGGGGVEINKWVSGPVKMGNVWGERERERERERAREREREGEREGETETETERETETETNR